MNPQVENIGSHLKAHGLRPSYQRIRIFDYIATMKNHPTVDMIYKALITDIPTLSKMTVYNTLKLFIEKKIATLISIEDSEARYDADTSLHGHYKCMQCGMIYDFDIETSSFALNGLKNFEIDETHIYIKGTCKKCLTNKIN